eukprot:TRINITY_DN14985_c3_g1_i1.p1 TRINITY_DN14985_c3_g1~~TRINITY_DN14985_c3_g1_i1.p1  ORF type:complete len:466 (+),score=63.04 TRINITY_DN14985_c3_g1_i1:136-1398(+)
MTYLASGADVRSLLRSARRIASSIPEIYRKEETLDTNDDSAPASGSSLTAVIVTDLIRSAQFKHATGVWVPAVPPLSLYMRRTSAASGQTPPLHERLHSEGTASGSSWVRAIALRPELWRRAAFGPGFQGMLRMFSLGSGVSVAFQRSFLPLTEIMAHDAALLVPWDNDVMSFYELYHEAMPMLVPSQELMTKWLPAVRWGSLEIVGDCKVRLETPSTSEGRVAIPWMGQTSLSSALAEGAYAWIGVSDYYRFPGVLHFSSVADLIAKLRTSDLGSITATMAQASRSIQQQSLSFQRRVLRRLLGLDARIEAGSDVSAKSEEVLKSSATTSRWSQLPLRGTCSQGFLIQADIEVAFQESRSEKENEQQGTERCLQLAEETAGSAVVVFNGYTCMVYDASCDTSNLRRDGPSASYYAWKCK